MNNVKELYEIWLKGTENNEEMHAELTAIAGNEDEILDRFYRNLEFGTAGLRGVLGAGTNRMNTYTVGQATQGLADYLNSQYEKSSVAIGYDSRIKSDVFAQQSAKILAANGIKVYLYPVLEPTPLISYAVMRLQCQSGIVITASHNPSKYNGYKCYDPRGYQMTEEAAAATYEYIQKTDMFTGVKIMDFDKAMAEGLIEYISDEILEEYYALCLKRPLHPEIVANSDVKIIYSPLNGTGNVPVRTVLDRAGYKNIAIVKEQEMPDGNFPTCPYPNPEIRQVFEKGLEMTATDKADLLLATDPDCDRVGTAVLTGDEYKLLSGNDIGALLVNYILSQRKALGTLPETPIIVKSFVSTKLVDKICEKYGAKLVDVLTGFKYIGEVICNLDAEGKKDNFIMGFEESYGYLIGDHARDKDAVAASLMICEMTAYYKSIGKTLCDVLNELYEEFGFYCNKLLSFTFEGADGMAKMAEIMADTAANTPSEIAGYKVLQAYNYNTSTVTDMESGAVSALTLPKANVLAFGLPDGKFAIIRPSGTEPKIKIYLTGIGDSFAEAEAVADKIGEGMKKLLKI
ncbi:MAG: phospho-sugar mutase [Clostridia bacterium]|nr:phospho-sugar mutase [Clostridia bacterium]